MNQHSAGNITHKATPEQDVFQFKKLGWNISNTMTLGFAVVWNSIIWGVFLDGAIVFFLIPFMLIGMILILLPFFVAYGKRSLIVNADFTIFQIHFLGYKHKRKRFTYDIQSIDHVTSKKHEGFSTIVIQTGTSFPLQFGRILTHEEKEWLTQKLQAVKKKYFDLITA